jgi:general secretion pathway protein G
MNYIKKQNAFSLMEMMVVLFIIGLILSMMGPRIMGMFGKAKVTGTKAILSQLKSSITEYNMDIGHYPRKDEGSLNALIEAPSRPEIAQKWEGPYTKEDFLRDKWDNEIIYNHPPEKHKDKFKNFEIISYGANGEEGGTGQDAELYDGA